MKKFQSKDSQLVEDSTIYFYCNSALQKRKGNGFVWVYPRKF